HRSRSDPLTAARLADGIPAPPVRVLFYYAQFRPLRSTLFPYTTLFRSRREVRRKPTRQDHLHRMLLRRHRDQQATRMRDGVAARSEEHTSELQSRFDLVCRLLLEKKKNLPRPRMSMLDADLDDQTIDLP